MRAALRLVARLYWLTCTAIANTHSTRASAVDTGPRAQTPTTTASQNSTSAMRLPPKKLLRALAVSAALTSPAAFAAAWQWRHWWGMRSDALAWLQLLLASALTVLWLVVLLVDCDRRLHKEP